MKHIVLFCLLFVFPFFTSAQTWSELNDSLIYYYNKGDYKKAIPFGEKTIIAAKAEVGESDISYANSVLYLGILFFYTGQHDKAEPLYLKAAELYKKISGETHTNYATSLNYLAGLYESRGNYDKEEPILIQATAIIKNTLGDNHADYASNLHTLALLYSNIGKYEKAESLFIESINIRKKVLGENHPDYATSLDKLGLLYASIGKYGKAEPLYIESIAIRKKVLGENHPDYTYSLIGLASLYTSMGNYEKAEPLYIESIAIQKKILGDDHQVYANSLNDLAGLYMSMGHYEKAELLYIQGTAAIKKAVGEDHPDYATSLNNQAGLYLNMGSYEKAETLYLRSTAIVKKVLGEEHPYYAASLQNLALLYTHTDNYEKAESFFLQAAAIRKKLGGETHPAYATLVNNLAILYEHMGIYEKAEGLLIQATAIRKKLYGDNHPDYAGSLNSLAALYANMGKYEKAEPLYIQAMAIRKKVLGEIHPDYATSLINLALLYESSGNNEKAERLYTQAIAIQKKVLGETHPDYSISLNNLALLYTNMGHYEQAEGLFIKAGAIIKKLQGENNTSYAIKLNNLARLYEKMGAYEKAESSHLHAKEIFKTLLGEDHPYYPTSLNNLAILYKNMGNYKKAEPLFIQATAIRKRVLGENHPDYATSLVNEAGLYESMGNYEKAEPLLASGNKIKIKNLLDIFSILSEKEKGNYLDKNVALNNTNNSFLYNNSKATPSFYKDNYNLQLLLKSLSLTDTKNSLEAVRNSKDTVIKKLLDRWQQDKVGLSKQYALPVAGRKADLKELETQTEDLEKELTRRSSEFRSQQKALRISMVDVQNGLEGDEVAIEFVRFHLYNKKLTDSVMYAAYILKKNSPAPFFVPLCIEKQLQHLFDSAGTTATSMVKSFYRSLEVKKKETVSLGKELYSLVWQPLEPYLKGVKKISYSPAGKLYSIAFHALAIDSATLLMDKYQLQQYSSTREIALRNSKDQFTRPTTITLFGNASFSMDSLQLAEQKNNQPGKGSIPTSIYAPQKRNSDNNTWDSLPGTAEEISKIKGLFSQYKIAAKIFIRTAASEENLKALDNRSPQVLHIATHGFFLPDPDKKKPEMESEQGNTYSLAKDPLLRSGLVLAGGNYAWSGKTPVQGVEDGIATAYEISQLNLSNTELVVLSACETALGDVKGSEGVFGLQRAFKMAGVKKMIVSLWQVPDKETAELMIAFYSNWIKGKTVNDAFTQAQADMRKKYPPFYWAAFVLVE
ncbi:MAG: tetratricopeptide repeat protein [Chitinophagaceae bacterium]